ncbi:MAG: hypothetical protein ACTSUE_00465 [Promethearchaeota archaeon]
MSSADGKTECPFCGKRYKNLKSHIKNIHMRDDDSPPKTKVKAKKKSQTIDELEASISSKFFKESAVATSGGSFQEPDHGLDEQLEDKEVEMKDKYGYFKKVEVDFWLTNLHSAKIGIYQKERFMAKNRSFSRNLDLVGAVHDAGRSDGMFGYNTESWDKVNQKHLAKKRLVLKWFNSKSVSHVGTIEEMIVDSISRSIGSNDTLPSFKIIIPRYKYVLNLQKEHTKLPKIGEIFTFAMKHEKADKWVVYSFDERRLTIGSDWTIKVRDGPVVGRIDEKLLNIGGKINVYFLNEELYKNKIFYRTVILFTMMLYFKQEILKKIVQIRRLLKDGSIDLDIASDEELFYTNPRAIKR